MYSSYLDIPIGAEPRVCHPDRSEAQGLSSRSQRSEVEGCALPAICRPFRADPGAPFLPTFLAGSCGIAGPGYVAKIGSTPPARDCANPGLKRETWGTWFHGARCYLLSRTRASARHEFIVRQKEAQRPLCSLTDADTRRDNHVSRAETVLDDLQFRCC
jgi:hypothetical protein